MGILKYFFNRARTKLFPTLREKEVQRYFVDGGDEQFRYHFDLVEESLVMDLGGYKGQWASDIYSIYNCRILIFEPVNSYYKKIVDRFKANSKIEVYKLALGEISKSVDIGLSDDGSSLYIKAQLKETIEFEDVAKFFIDHDINQLDLLKINIEGGEYELMNRLIETGLVTKIRQIHVQFHDFIPDANSRMKVIAEKLAKTHNLTMQYSFVWENWVLQD